MGSVAVHETEGVVRMSIIADDTLSKEERIELIKLRINWINEHEKMFEITSMMNLERVLLREELEALQKG